MYLRFSGSREKAIIIDDSPKTWNAARSLFIFGSTRGYNLGCEMDGNNSFGSDRTQRLKSVEHIGTYS